MNSPIIFLHGFTGSSNSWSNFLNKINFSSVAIDLPGHGNNKIKNLKKKYKLNDWEQEFQSTLKIKKLNEDGNNIPDSEKETINNIIGELRDLIKKEDYDNLEQKMKELEQLVANNQTAQTSPYNPESE